MVQEKKRKIEFQGHLGYPIGTILAIFDLQVTPMLPTKFQVNWPFGSGEEAKNRFSRWLKFKPKIPKCQNITEAENKALKSLCQNTNIVIKPADKGGAVMIMNKVD